MKSGLTFGDGMGKTTINDITTTKNTEDDDASNDNYFVESDFTEILITDTMVNADDAEITTDPQDTNYYPPIQDEEISNNNDETQEIDENISLHDKARGRDEETRPEEAQSSNGNDNLIPSVETRSNDAHLMGDNETTKAQEATSDDPTSEMSKSTQT